MLNSKIFILKKVQSQIVLVTTILKGYYKITILIHIDRDNMISHKYYCNHQEWALFYLVLNQLTLSLNFKQS